MKPKNWNIWEGYPNRPEERFIDEAPRPQFSGLYDAHGNPLYKQQNPIGFVTDPSRQFIK